MDLVHRESYQLRRRMNAELLANVAAMVAYRQDTEIQCRRDLFAGFTLTDVTEHFSLSGS